MFAHSGCIVTAHFDHCHLHCPRLQERERGDEDIVEVSRDRNMIVVNETKVKVDLTKYLERHQFVFDEVRPSISLCRHRQPGRRPVQQSILCFYCKYALRPTFAVLWFSLHNCTMYR